MSGSALSTTLLELRGVRAGYDGITVLHGVDLAVAAGQTPHGRTVSSS